MGIAVKPKGNEIKFQYCPYCKSSRSDQWTFSINAVTGAFCCPRASCGEQGHFVELARDFDYTLQSIAQSQYKELPQVRLVTSTPAEEYLFRRGIRKEVTRAYGITTNPNDPNQLIFPFYTRATDADGQIYDRMEFVKYRLIDYDRSRHKCKEWCESGCKPVLFGMDHCSPEKSRTLVITEGQIDSLSLTSAGIPNAVSVPNGARGFTWAEHCREFVSQFDTIVVFGDCERGRITLVDDIRELFPNAKVRIPRIKDYLGEKDANDILRSFGERAVRKAVEKAEAFKPSTVKEMADVQPVNLNDVPHIRTMFPRLDDAIGGLYEGQLITLTGKRGTGKSTLASMLAVAALWQNWNVLIYSGEMADYEVKRWIDFQIAGEESIKEKVYTSTTGYYIGESEERQLADWYRSRLFIVDNNAMEENAEHTEITDVIVTAVRTYGVQLVIVDNLMTAINAGEDIYIRQSKFARKLKAIARKLHIVIVLVAHPRKSKSRELESDEISGSGDVANLSDTVLVLDRVSKTKDDGEKIHQTLLAVQKNRATGTLLQGDERIPLRHSKKSKRIYQQLDKGICQFPFNLDTAKRTETKPPF
ncbi:MAG: DnaB-like helicase C-terminal domain-containing protein [Ruminococcus sp.]